MFFCMFSDHIIIKEFLPFTLTQNILSPLLPGRVFILRSSLRYNDLHFMPRQVAKSWLIEIVQIDD